MTDQADGAQRIGKPAPPLLKEENDGVTGGDKVGGMGVVEHGVDGEEEPPRLAGCSAHGGGPMPDRRADLQPKLGDVTDVEHGMVGACEVHQRASKP